MSKKFMSYQTVRIVDESYERHGQVGTFVGDGDVAGEVAVKFEGEKPEDEQVTDTFPEDAVEAI